jgi:hypothetical protein
VDAGGFPQIEAGGGECFRPEADVLLADGVAGSAWYVPNLACVRSIEETLRSRAA